MKTCNYQKVVTDRERESALAFGRCEICGVSASELKERGESMEVCGEEYSARLGGGGRVLTPVALCPSCHKDYHLDAHHEHNQCQVKARQSRESTF